MKKYTIAIAGSTARTTLCAEALKSDPRFEISWILTPKPKPIGRKKIISPNSLDVFARENSLPIVYIKKKVDEIIKDQILSLENTKKTKKITQTESGNLKPNSSTTRTNPDFLLVVDFGYFIPNWLLNLPKIAPLNIHPSELPKWRGSSPGQFSILFNDKKSAVTLMVVNNKFDQGPIIHQDFFDIDSSWTQADYYTHAFKLICNGLGEKIAKFGTSIKKSNQTKNTANNNPLNLTATKPQPEKSPTITAKMLKKDQAFVPWEIVKIAMSDGKLPNNFDATNSLENNSQSNQKNQLSNLLLTALEHNKSLALTLERASKAFDPWPGLWTIVPTQKGEKRMKLLELDIKSNNNKENNKLILKTVQIEGKSPTPWNEIKNITT